MANIRSKEKNIRRIEKATTRNRIYKSRVRKAIKNLKTAIDNNSDNIKELLNVVHKVIDKAVSKSVLHSKTGARKKSRLDKFANKSNN
ncbi:MAG: 30S ribosomal protein S20 [Mollicutes bacterium PWAP]|nr:30S ribosomal protein S20 [Mollicutes bacterium PWAP]